MVRTGRLVFAAGSGAAMANGAQTKSRKLATNFFAAYAMELPSELFSSGPREAVMYGRRN
jgi:hypothetical protein